MNAPGHPGSPRDERFPAVSFDVVTLPGARGAALWRWWLESSQRRAGSAGFQACPAHAYASPPDPPRDASRGVTVIRLGPDDDRPAGIVIDL